MNEINISKIIGAYPIGTQVYSPAYGNCLYQGLEAMGAIRLKKFLDGNLVILPENGIIAYGGELMLYPSRKMRDWDKLVWKHGDVLWLGYNKFGVFDKWTSSDFTTCRIVWINSEKEGVDDKFETKYGSIAKDIDKAAFLFRIKDEYFYELNLETLELDKPRKESKETLAAFQSPKFKDGDIVVVDYIEDAKFICIYNKIENGYLYCFARVNSHNGELYLKKAFLKVNLDNRNILPATDSERKQLFDALAKKNKAWDAEKKQIVGLHKKCELKPFDKVLVRDRGDERWEIEFFGYYDEDEQKYVVSAGIRWNFCIPYNDSTKHLLGTTDEWKGGEG